VEADSKYSVNCLVYSTIAGEVLDEHIINERMKGGKATAQGGRNGR